MVFTQISTDKCDIKIQFEHFNDNKINSVLSSSGQGPGQVPGQVQKVQRLRANIKLNLVCHPPTHHSPPSELFMGDNDSNHYCMTSKHVSLISSFKMTFRMTFRMTFKMTFRMAFSLRL